MRVLGKNTPDSDTQRHMRHRAEDSASSFQPPSRHRVQTVAAYRPPSACAHTITTDSNSGASSHNWPSLKSIFARNPPPETSTVHLLKHRYLGRPSKKQVLSSGSAVPRDLVRSNTDHDSSLQNGRGLRLEEICEVIAPQTALARQTSPRVCAAWGCRLATGHAYSVSTI